jgi:hypothetical protein
MALTAGAQAAPPDAPTTGRSMSSLVEDLGDKEFGVRQRATQALRRLGTRSLPALRAAANHCDFEVRHRARLVRMEVERAEATDATPISLPRCPLRISEAVELVSKQTGYRFDIAKAAPEDELFHFDIHQASFWHSLDTICIVGGLGLWSIDDGTIRLVKRQAPTEFVVRKGALRLSVEALQDTRTLRFGGDTLPESRADALDLTLTVHSEPKLAILNLGAPTVLEAIDEHRHSMIDSEECSRHEAKLRNGLLTTRSYRLATLLRLRRCVNSTRIERIRGIIPVTVLQNDVAEAEIDDLQHASGTVISTSAGQLTFEEMSRAPDQHSRAYTLRLSLKRPAGSRAGGDWCTSVEQRLALQGARGERWSIQDLQWLHRGPDDASLRLTADSRSDEAPQKLLFTSWNSFEYPLDFEFRAVPLP